MRTIQVDENNDFTVDASGNLTLLVDGAGVPQTARQYASTLRGEMIHASTQGVPYFEFAFGAAPNLGQFSAALRARLLECPGVQEVQRLDVDRVDDTLNYTATLLTDYGRITING